MDLFIRTIDPQLSIVLWDRIKGRAHIRQILKQPANMNKQSKWFIVTRYVWKVIIHVRQENAPVHSLTKRITSDKCWDIHK